MLARWVVEADRIAEVGRVVQTTDYSTWIVWTRRDVLFGKSCEKGCGRGAQCAGMCLRRAIWSEVRHVLCV